MLHRRIIYLEVLAAAVLFQIFFEHYFATFLLVLLVLFPLLSLLLSLPVLLRCFLRLTPQDPAVPRGAGAGFCAALDNPSHLPLARLRFRLVWENQLTGERGRQLQTISGASEGARLTQSFPTDHCGRVVGRIQQARVCDLLGLFALPVRTHGASAVLVLPIPLEEDRPPETGGGQGGTVLRPRPGGGPGEDYDLRDYRAGDPLRSVHWKLSSKRDELVVRETLEPRQAPLVLTFDHFGPPEQVERTLDRLYGLSRQLLRREQPHHIQWADPASGAVEDCAVESERALMTCLERICSTPAPLQGRSILDGALRLPGGAGRPRHLHVTAAGVEGGGG